MERDHHRDAEVARRRNVGTFLYRQLQQQEQLKPLLSLYIQDTVQKGASRDYKRLEKMVVRYLEQPTLEKHVCRERQLEKPAAGAGAANGKSKGRGKTLIGDCVQWTTKGSVLSM